LDVQPGGVAFTGEQVAHAGAVADRGQEPVDQHCRSFGLLAYLAGEVGGDLPSPVVTPVALTTVDDQTF
jgi:hypothetical protein